MGTINYGTSDYITIGYNLNWNDSDFETWEEMENEKQLDIEDTYNNIQAILNKYDFTFYHVTIEPGYYEGFCINIKNNFPYCYDSREDKRAAQKEVTELKAFLIECVNTGLVQVWPGWCTSYKTHNESIEAIKTAIKEMRAEIKSISTWYTLNQLGEAV